MYLNVKLLLPLICQMPDSAGFVGVTLGVSRGRDVEAVARGVDLDYCVGAPD